MKKFKDTIIYVPESKEFIINGMTINENTLQEQEIIKLKEKSKIQSLLVGNNITQQNKSNLLI